MTAPAEVSEVQSAATRDMDDLVHLPRCGDGNTAMCEELDDLFPCVCEPGCDCCGLPRIDGAEPSLVIFDEVHYFTGGAA